MSIFIRSIQRYNTHLCRYTYTRMDHHLGLLPRCLNVIFLYPEANIELQKKELDPSEREPNNNIIRYKISMCFSSTKILFSKEGNFVLSLEKYRSPLCHSSFYNTTRTKGRVTKTQTLMIKVSTSVSGPIKGKNGYLE